MNTLETGKTRQIKGRKRSLQVQDVIPVITLVVLVVIATVLNPSSFFTPMNLLNILRQSASLIVVSMGMLLVILTGGIDLSVGSMWGLGAVTVSLLANSLPTTLAVLLTIVIMTAVGCISGFFVSYRRLAPFVVTLAMMVIAGPGVAYIISGQGKQIILKSNSWLLSFEKDAILGIPLTVIFTFIVFTVIVLVLRYTGFGRLIKAIGSNETAVRLSGIRVKVFKMSVYAISGCLCGLAGIMATARNGGAKFDFGSGMELQAIAAVVVGGASLSGGRGTALNTLMGVLILHLIRNIMNLSGVGPAYQQIFTGVIIIIAVLLQSFRKKAG